jgi:hypothetical protein
MKNRLATPSRTCNHTQGRVLSEGMKRHGNARPMTTSEAGRLGARKLNESLTPEQRREAARKAVKARWAKAKKKQ